MTAKPAQALLWAASSIGRDEPRVLFSLLDTDHAVRRNYALRVQRLRCSPQHMQAWDMPRDRNEVRTILDT